MSSYISYSFSEALFIISLAFFGWSMTSSEVYQKKIKHLLKCLVSNTKY